MKINSRHFALAPLIVLLTLIQTSDGIPEFRAAVFEHRPINVMPAASPENLMAANLAQFEVAAQVAARHGAELIVFPEYGTYSSQGIQPSRDALLPYLQIIPQDFVPCTTTTKGSEAILKLACMAKTNNITIVANLGTVHNCTKLAERPTCPPDGRLQFNTNLVFDGSSGRIIAAYHKVNLFAERNFDQPRVEHVTFRTRFGQVGLGICFDLLFREPLISMVESEPVRMVVLPTLWFNRLPFLAMYEIAEAWAVRMNTYLLVANIHDPKNALVGSGIFGPNGVVNYSYVVDVDSGGQLVMANLPESDLRKVPSEN